jgi:hypothetical protein
MTTTSATELSKFLQNNHLTARTWHLVISSGFADEKTTRALYDFQLAVEQYCFRNDKEKVEF